MPSFAQRFKQPLHSDCELVLRLQTLANADEDRAAKRARLAAQDQASRTSPEVLAAFPAHRLVLCSSNYFEAQVLNWQTASSSTAAATNSSEQQAQTEKLVLTLTIASADELPAAEAVIAGMYGVEDALSQLAHHQLVQALIIADMIDADEVAKQVSQQLETAIKSQHSLSAAALNVMAGLAAWPPCLLQLLPSIVQNASCCRTTTPVQLDAVLAADKNKVMQRMLSSVFGDLQAVWRDEELQGLLLWLPCRAMLLLLSSDELRVPSEDLVLFTAQTYADDRQSSSTVKKALGECVRAPHLSDVMLHYVLLSKDTSESILGHQATKVKELLLLRRSRAGPEDTTCYEEYLQTLGGPKSWLLGQRQLVDAVAATVELRLSVEQLKEACRQALAKNGRQIFYSPASPPVSGFVLSMSLCCEVIAGGVGFVPWVWAQIQTIRTSTSGFNMLCCSTIVGL